MHTTSIGLNAANSQVDLTTCSPQVRELYPLHDEYRQQVQKLWADTADHPGPRKLQQRGYRYLVSLYYEMPKRAETDGKPMSPEFKDLVFFCRYVGPRTAAKHSLHRLDNDIGYCVGNVEWADKRKQAEVRRSTQHHLYLGRRLTDRTLAEFLKAKGHKITEEAIKKWRWRRTKKGIALTDITRSIFEKYGLSYETSTDPVEAWDFPPAFHEKLTKLYPHYRGTHETRIYYFLRWLYDQEQMLTKHLENPHTAENHQSELASLIYKYKCERNWAQTQLMLLHEQKLQKVLADAKTPFAPQPQLIEVPKKPEENHAMQQITAAVKVVPDHPDPGDGPDGVHIITEDDKAVMASLLETAKAQGGYYSKLLSKP